MTSTALPTHAQGTSSPCAIPGTPLAQEAAGLDLCVHCGLCLQSCPTYLARDDENDSPRGRLVLMRALVDGELTIDDPVVATHIDRCLGCRGCETACPAGVPYGQLLEATRATLLKARPLAWFVRAMLLVFSTRWLSVPVFAAGRLLRATGATRLLARLPGAIGAPFALLEASRPALHTVPYRPPPVPDPAARVAPLRGCAMDGLFPATNQATERVLQVNGYAVCDTPNQGYCGALHAHAGDLEGAQRLARHNIGAFERSGADFIAVNASGCGAMMKEYEHLLHDDPAWAPRAAALAARVRDVSELLAARGPVTGSPLAHHVTYDAPCHLVHAQRVATAPVQLLTAIPGLSFTPLVDSEQCCGGAGIYNLQQPELSARILSPKVANVLATGATLVATGNPGCHMQIGGGLVRCNSEVRAVHPVDLLDHSYSQRFTPSR